MSTEQDIINKGTESANGNDSNRLFPIFLKLEELSVLVVGAGKVGLEKLTAITSNAPATVVEVVATKISDPVRELAEQYPNIKLRERAFAVADLDSKDIVVIAVNDKEVSQAIRAL